MLKKITIGCILSLLLITANANAIKTITLDQIAQYELGQTMVIIPGYKASIGGKEVSLYGNEPCPKNNDIRTFFIGGTTSADTNCIVLTDTSKVVNVITIINKKVAYETWTVEHRYPEGIILRNQNGDYVQPL